MKGRTCGEEHRQQCTKGISVFVANKNTVRFIKNNTSSSQARVRQPPSPPAAADRCGGTQQCRDQGRGLKLPQTKSQPKTLPPPTSDVLSSLATSSTNPNKTRPTPFLRQSERTATSVRYSLLISVDVVVVVEHVRRGRPNRTTWRVVGKMFRRRE